MKSLTFICFTSTTRAVDLHKAAVAASPSVSLLLLASIPSACLSRLRRLFAAQEVLRSSARLTKVPTSSFLRFLHIRPCGLYAFTLLDQLPRGEIV